MNVACDECGSQKRPVAMSQRLNPRNWKPEQRRLCTPCRTKLKFQTVSYQRTHTPGSIHPSE